MIGLPLDWDTATSTQGKTYYYNTNTHETTWDCPPLEAPNDWWYGKRTDDFFNPQERMDVVSSWEDVLIYLWGRRVNIEFQRASLSDPMPVWNTLCYLFFHVRCGVYCLVHEGELKAFMPFCNTTEFTNTLDHIQLPTLTLDSFLQEYATRANLKPGWINTIVPRVKQWWCEGNLCRIQPINMKQYDLKTLYTMVMMLAPLSNTSEFFINLCPHPVLRHDRLEPFCNVFGGDSTIPSIHRLVLPWVIHANLGPPDCAIPDPWEATFAPIFSTFVHSDFEDRPLPVRDDWLKSWKEYGTTIDWDHKFNIAFFRGSASGLNTTIERNPRLHLVHLSHQCDNAMLLDAKLIDWNNKALKFGHDGVLRCLDPHQFAFGVNLFNYLPMRHHEEYKYLLYVEGNGVASRRLGALLASGSVVLVVASTLPQVWLMEYCVPWKHFVPVSHDLSDLAKRIQWCREHDDECRRIARDARALVDKKTHITSFITTFHVPQQLSKK